ncbi:protein Mpv17-like [Aphis craccivora]|uniref:Mitochondrial inner membrane protein Mpv17 n=1 Tax=Aphis craccivora TaxID=307492 RepID=A0A6G0VT15_APHCR|nr:protein Mpv17-like [Aphis craccivora]
MMMNTNRNNLEQSPIMAYFKWYRYCSNTYPIRTNLVQTGLLFGFGDFMAQSAIEKRKSDEIDWLRTVRYASIGCAVGPTLSMWYKTLDRLGTKNSISLVTKKILVDQLFASPIINGAVMIMSRVFSGDEWPQIQNKLEDNYMKVMLTSYLIWPAVQAFNFTIVPQQYRVLMVQIVSLAWNTYLSYMSVGGGKSEQT